MTGEGGPKGLKTMIMTRWMMSIQLKVPLMRERERAHVSEDMSYAGCSCECLLWLLDRSGMVRGREGESGQQGKWASSPA